MSDRWWPVFCELRETLREAGYNVRARIVNFAQLGVPQERFRLVMLASLAGSPTFPSSAIALQEFSTSRSGSVIFRRYLAEGWIRWIQCTRRRNIAHRRWRSLGKYRWTAAAAPPRWPGMPTQGTRCLWRIHRRLRTPCLVRDSAHDHRTLSHPFVWPLRPSRAASWPDGTRSGALADLPWRLVLRGTVRRPVQADRQRRTAAGHAGDRGTLGERPSFRNSMRSGCSR